MEHFTKRGRKSQSATGADRNVFFGFDKIFKEWPCCLAALLTFTYLFRNTVLIYWVPGSSTALFYSSYAALALCLAYVISTPKIYLFSGAVLLLSWLPSLFINAGDSQQFLRVVAIGSLVAIVGPVLDGGKVRRFRGWAWRFVCFFCIFSALASSAWYLLGLPSYWRGSFTGVMTYAMLVGPFAALGSLYALSEALKSNSLIWLSLAILSLIPCVASGSRLAVSCYMGAALIMFVSYFRSLKFLLTNIAVLGLVYFSIDTFQKNTYNKGRGNLANELISKGLTNTREDLWSARVSEFKSKPFFGVGIGNVDAGSSGEGINELRTVEPGSSYLAILSMTGIFGGLAYLVVLGSICLQWWRMRRYARKSKIIEGAVFGGFFAIHMVGEGWVLAAGSPICLVYWLWMGHFYDTLTSIRARRTGAIAKSFKDDSQNRSRPELRGSLR